MLRTLVAVLGLMLVATVSRAQVCGNGVIEAGEQCDDGNPTDGDGCDVDCRYSGCDVSGVWNGTLQGLPPINARLQEHADGTIFGAVFFGTSPTPISTVEGTRDRGMVEATLLGSGVMPDCDNIIFDLPFPLFFSRTSPHRCGDGMVSGIEECDDGNDLDGDDCSRLCLVPACGNQFIDGDEECDDGNLDPSDGCNAECRRCGNGVIDSGEECDDGNTANGDGCSALCRACGNGVIDAGEECDDGNTTGGDACTPGCLFAGCPMDGVWTDGTLFRIHTIREAADGTLVGYTYDPFLAPTAGAALIGSRQSGDVTLSFGGITASGRLRSCEEASLTDPNTGYQFRRLTTAVCGDGVRSFGEPCDDGNSSNLDDCTTLCRHPFCGNGIVDAGEPCDDGNQRNGDGCDTNCTLPACGNERLDAAEQCDDGNRADGDGCNADCTLPLCGNAVLDDGEPCDPSLQPLCTRNCTLPACGNGILDAGEGCDDGNGLPCDGCGIDCVVEIDPDGDRIGGGCDNCPLAYNPAQRDRDADGRGDACDTAIGVPTAAGSAVEIAVDDLTSGNGFAPSALRALSVTFATVAAAGVTQITPQETAPNRLLQDDLQASPLGAQFVVASSATAAGPIAICATYDDALLSAADEARLLLVQASADGFADVTSSRDADANRICASAAQVGRFVLGLPVTPLARARTVLRRQPAVVAADTIERLAVRFAAGALDPTASGVRISLLRDGAPIFQREIAAGLWTANRAGTVFRFSDPSGAQAFGVTRATLRSGRRGQAALSVEGSGIDLSGVDPDRLAVRIDIGLETAAAESVCRTTSRPGDQRLRCTRPRN